MMAIYVAGAWVEQHQRARPMMARLREADIEITFDWTQPEGDMCSCGHPRSEHTPLCEREGDGDDCCHMFNGIGTGSDSTLSPEDRRKHALADLAGVLRADVVWLLAANDKGACGSWVELGAALANRASPDALNGWPIIVVSGAKWNRTIFTELADKHFETDAEAIQYVLGLREI